MAAPAAACYTDISSKGTTEIETEETMMKYLMNGMKGMLLGILLAAAAVAAQLALTWALGFRIAEMAGSTALTFLFFFFLFRSTRKRREPAARETDSI